MMVSNISVQFGVLTLIDKATECLIFTLEMVIDVGSFKKFHDVIFYRTEIKKLSNKKIIQVNGIKDKFDFKIN